MRTIARRSEPLARLIRQVVAGFAPPQKLTVSEWADKYRYLSPESSAEPGPWRTSRTPYLKRPMDCVSDPKVRRIVMEACSQVGKSEFINNAIGYIIDQDPASILFVHPTTVDAKEYSRLRIAPMIRDCRTVNRKVSQAKSRDSGNTVLQKSFQGGILTMCGSTEAHALASKPIRYLLADERDRWATSAGREGDPWELAVARQKTFYNAIALEVSTPTIKDASAIEDSYFLGTQEKWCTRCPHCEEYHEIVFDSIRFEYDEVEVNGKKTYRVTEVWYICPECGAISDEYAIKHEDAKWIADNPAAYEDNGVVSFRMNTFMSPWTKWDNIVLQFLESRGNPEKLKVFFNTSLGRPWEDRTGLPDEGAIMARREDYPAELPDGVLVLTMGIDTQDDRFEYEVVGYGIMGETWGIKKGVIMGCPNLPDTQEKLDDARRHVFRYKNGKGLRVSMAFIDEQGHFARDVRLYCRARQHEQVYAIRGRGGQGVPYVDQPKRRTIMVNNRYMGEYWLYNLGVDAGKRMIMDNLRVQTPGARYCHFPRSDGAGYGTAYFLGLLSEHLVYDKKSKNPWQWKVIPGRERNEPLDCRNYANAAFHALSPDMDALLRRRRGQVDKPPAAKPQPNAAPRRQSVKERFMDEW